ncbi:MAG: hypothetical protein GEV28_15395 [Actinophytocola sp.]|uniref:hypothetical protein n=1 Tax=Actinophytocola sp. TaxID=1872138 RepID=UPI00132C7D54|nr:hypothetical protein [Actinophytocola sp.]MPZ81704.1 hypothetical protein [Actinophytocola sp.]
MIVLGQVVLVVVAPVMGGVAFAGTEPFWVGAVVGLVVGLVFVLVGMRQLRPKSPTAGWRSPSMGFASRRAIGWIASYYEPDGLRALAAGLGKSPHADAQHTAAWLGQLGSGASDSG